MSPVTFLISPATLNLFDNTGFVLKSEVKSTSLHVRNEKLLINFFFLFNFKDKPKDTQATMSSGEVKLGDRLDIACSARANPSPEYKFYYNDKLIRWSSKGLLSFTSVKTEDQGTYRCVPVNYLGDGSEASVTVTLSTGM